MFTLSFAPEKATHQQTNQHNRDFLPKTIIRLWSYQSPLNDTPQVQGHDFEVSIANLVGKLNIKKIILTGEVQPYSVFLKTQKSP